MYDPLSNASKHKVDTNLLLIGDNVALLHHQRVLLTEIPGELLVHPHLFHSCYIKLQFDPKLN